MVKPIENFLPRTSGRGGPAGLNYNASKYDIGRI